MLVDVPACQLLLNAVAIQKGFPLLDVSALGRRQGLGFAVGRAGLQPMHQGRVLACGDRREAVGHPPRWVLALEAVEFLYFRAILRPCRG